MKYTEHNKEVLNSLVDGEVTLATKGGTPMKVEVINSTGYEQQISTLTALKAEIVDQKVYDKQLSDFITVGTEGGYSDSITYFTNEYVGALDGKSASGDGVAGQGSNVDYKIEKKIVKIDEWMKGYDVSETEMNQAVQGINRSAIVSKEKSLEAIKKSFLVRRAFEGDSVHEGLLTLSTVSTDVTTMPTKLSNMTIAQIKVAIPDMYSAYRSGNNFTADASVLLMGEEERIKLSKIYSDQFGISNLEIVRKQLAEITGNANFAIVGVRYADAAQRSDGDNLFMLYNKDVVEMQLPVEKEMIWPQGFNTRADKKVRVSEVYITRPQEALYFEPVDEQ